MTYLSCIHHHNYDQRLMTVAKVVGPVGCCLTAIAVATIAVPAISAAITFAAVPLAIAGGALIIAAIVLVAARHICPISEAARNFDWDSILELPERTDKKELESLKQLLLNCNISSCKYKKILVNHYNAGTMAALTIDDSRFSYYAREMNNPLPHDEKDILYLFVATNHRASDVLKERAFYRPDWSAAEYPGVKVGYIPYSQWSDSHLSSSTLESLGLL